MTTRQSYTTPAYQWETKALREEVHRLNMALIQQRAEADQKRLALERRIDNLVVWGFLGLMVMAVIVFYIVLLVIAVNRG